MATAEAAQPDATGPRTGSRWSRLTFSQQILVGLALGVIVGLFLGDRVAPLKIVADGFVKLLQMTVLPYVTVSIVVSLGSLDLAVARDLGKRAGAVLLCLWAIGIGFSLLIPLVFPPAETASFFTSSLVEKPPPFDFVGLYIPSNPFYSLANNVVPAVVLFSALVGIALIGIERKEVLLDVLQVARTAIARATRFVVRLMPYGIFALTATAAGTLDVDQVQRIQVYLIAYGAVSLLVALWVLPGLVAALTPIPYRAVLGPTRDALVTAFVAGDLFIVLPILIDACKTLLERHLGAEGRSAAALPDLIVPVSFNFPHTGKLLSLSFILFAGWFAEAPIPLLQYPRLAVTGLLTFFGSLNAAVPFLLDSFRIPADTFQLFLATGVINSRMGSLVAAVHTIVMALLGSAAMAGAIRVESRRLIRYLVVTLVLTVVVIGGLRVTFRTLLKSEFKGAEIVYGMTNALEHEPSRIVDRAPSSGEAGPVLDRIRARGALRIGFILPRPPFVFRNGRQELVGVDLELAHLLAADLNVRAEFVEWPADQLVDAVSRGDADIGIGGMPVTPSSATRCLFSVPYMDETAAFVVKDYLRDRFETWTSIDAAKDLSIAVPPLPYYQRLLQSRLPNVSLKTTTPGEDPLDERAGFDAVALPAERGSFLTLLHPEWTVVVPQPGVIKVPLAFPLANHDPDWGAFVNTWIEMKRRDGAFDVLYRHWILGEAARQPAPRWSILRNVLHWRE